MRIFSAAALPVIILAASQCASGFQTFPSQMSVACPFRLSAPSATGVCRTRGAWMGGDLCSTSNFFAPSAKAAVHGLRGARGRGAKGPWMVGGGQDPEDKSGQTPRAKRALQDLITQVGQGRPYALHAMSCPVTAPALGHHHPPPMDSLPPPFQARSLLPHLNPAQKNSDHECVVCLFACLLVCLLVCLRVCVQRAVQTHLFNLFNVRNEITAK